MYFSPTLEKARLDGICSIYKSSWCTRLLAPVAQSLMSYYIIIDVHTAQNEFSNTRALYLYIIHCLGLYSVFTSQPNGRRHIVVFAGVCLYVTHFYLPHISATSCNSCIMFCILRKPWRASDFRLPSWKKCEIFPTSDF